jgi:ectonucleotide pyrophosphatase/phosphodiesterase family protein 5
MWPGEPFGFGPNKLRSTHVLKYNPRVPWEDRVDIALSWFVNATHPANFVAFYVEEPDKSGHELGPDSPEVRSCPFIRQRL